MTPEQFVKLAKNERDQMLAKFLDPQSGSGVAKDIAALNLDPDRAAALRGILAGVLTEVFYTWLLALDGCASFGGLQRVYILKDEDGSLLTDCGAIEAAAYEALHGGSASAG
jgi:hypothetical protein